MLGRTEVGTSDIGPFHPRCSVCPNCFAIVSHRLLRPKEKEKIVVLLDLGLAFIRAVYREVDSW